MIDAVEGLKHIAQSRFAISIIEKYTILLFTLLF